MPADATDVLQTLALSLSAAYGVGKGIKNYPAEKQDLVMRLNWDLYQIEKLKRGFDEDRIDTSQWTPEDKNICDETLNYLDGLAKRLQTTKLQLEKTTGTAEVVTGSAMWWHWGPELEKIANELFRWTTSFEIHLLTLPRSIRASVDLDITSDAEPGPCLVAQRRIEAFQALSTAAKLQQGQDLKMTDYGTSIGCLAERHVYADYHDQRVIIEFKSYRGALAPDRQAFLQNLCATLNRCDPSCSGVLKTAGFFDQSDYKSTPNGEVEPRVGIVYFVPSRVISDGRKPLTLSQLLNWTSSRSSSSKSVPDSPKHPLDQRFDLARKLANGLLFIHAVGWVHKAIKPANILVFRSESDKDKGEPPKFLGDPFRRHGGYEG